MRESSKKSERWWWWLGAEGVLRVCVVSVMLSMCHDED